MIKQPIMLLASHIKSTNGFLKDPKGFLMNAKIYRANGNFQIEDQISMCLSDKNLEND